MGLTLLMIKFYSVRVCTHKYVAQNRKSQLKMTDDRTANFFFTKVPPFAVTVWAFSIEFPPK